MYDRPPEMFKETSISEKHELFGCLAEKYAVFKSKYGIIFKLYRLKASRAKAMGWFPFSYCLYVHQSTKTFFFFYT